MNLHNLKTWPQYFDAIEQGRKTLEIRKNDRGFAVGDILRLLEYYPAQDKYTGNEAYVLVTDILHGAPKGARGYFGVADGYCAMSIRVIQVSREVKQIINARHAMHEVAQ